MFDQSTLALYIVIHVELTDWTGQPATIWDRLQPHRDLELDKWN